jgi:hypothetical protein
MPLQKMCNRCKQEKPTNAFYANKRMKDGLNTFCIECHKADNVTRKAKNRAQPEFREAELEYKKAYREKNVGQRAAYITQWRARKKAHVAAYSAAYRQANRARSAYLCQKRKIALTQRIPKWLTDDDFWVIEQAYELAALRTERLGVEFHVDHVIPLRGRNVSGLHVPQNLQVVTWLENQRKSNFYEV